MNSSNGLWLGVKEICALTMVNITCHKLYNFTPNDPTKVLNGLDSFYLIENGNGAGIISV